MKSQDRIIEHIKNLTNVDVTPYRTPEHERRGWLCLYGIPKTIEVEVQRLANSYNRFEMLNNGGLGIVLKEVKK